MQGFLGGAAAATKLADEKQKEFISAVDAYTAEIERINAQVDAVGNLPVIHPETKEAYETAKSNLNTPLGWMALVSLLANAGVAGAVVKGKTG